MILFIKTTSIFCAANNNLTLIKSCSNDTNMRGSVHERDGTLRVTLGGLNNLANTSTKFEEKLG